MYTMQFCQSNFFCSKIKDFNIFISQPIVQQMNIVNINFLGRDKLKQTCLWTRGLRYEREKIGKIKPLAARVHFHSWLIPERTVNISLVVLSSWSMQRDNPYAQHVLGFYVFGPYLNFPAWSYFIDVQFDEFNQVGSFSLCGAFKVYPLLY